MRIVLLLHQIILLGTLMFLCATACLAVTAASSPEAHRLERIKARIDSLEVEKQAEKRNGRSISELEQITALLQDSVALLRKELLQPQQVAVPAAAGRLEPWKKYLPATLGVVDAILIAAGAITLLFATLFLFFLVRAASLRRKKNGSRQPPHLHAGRQPDEIPGMDATARKAYGAQAVKPSGGPVSADMPQIQPEAPPVAPAPAAPLADLNALVVQASRNGLDSKAIAQRFNIGIDQVTLILKMAQRAGR